jgi:hypothetical protein
MKLNWDIRPRWVRASSRSLRRQKVSSAVSRMPRVMVGTSATIITRGLCMTSRPTMNFCRLPPERLRAAAMTPLQRTSKRSMQRAAASRARVRLISP